MAVASHWVVERFNVIRSVGNGNFPILVDSLFDAHFLQTAEERFGNRVVPAVSPPAHAWFETIRFAEASPIATTILDGFKPSSQHYLIGGGDGCKEAMV